MSERVRRIAAIVAADMRIRFRRPSTIIIFLLLSGFAYVWVPDPSTGMTLMVINGRRAIYNSATIATGTASLATLFVGLAGYYVISNAIRRDTRTRCGFVIASTTMRTSEYLLGKFLGNVIFLTTFMSGFMITSMVMLIVRGEAALQPLVFLWTYGLLVPPVIMFVSGVALVFESIPFLSGKFGDVVYFFLWAATLGFVAALIEHGKSPGVAAYFDYTGMGFMLDSMNRALHTTHVAIGHTSFDRAKGVFAFDGLRLAPEWIAPRMFAFVSPIALVGVARPFFHRFDPALVKATTQRSGRNWLPRAGAIVKPLSALAWRFAPRRGDSLANAAVSDALLTIAQSPLILAASIVIAIVSLASPAASIMPIAFVVTAIAIADIASREKRSGTLGLVFTSPHLRMRFVAWKLASTSVTALLMLAAPALRLIVERPSSAPYVVTGIAFVVSLATTLAIVSANPKTFLVLFLTFWYVVMNDSGKLPALDLAGWRGIATPAVLVSYLTLTIVAVAAAELFHRSDLRRNW